MGVETHRWSQDGKGDRNVDGNGAVTETGTGVETPRRTQDGSEDGKWGGTP